MRLLNMIATGSRSHIANSETPPCRLTKLMSAGLVVVAAVVLCTNPVGQSLAQGEVLTLAVAEIQYSDTSGEMIDQSDDQGLPILP